MREVLNIILAGVGGQGGVVAARIIGESALEAGYHVAVGETYGASQRGGSVVTHIRLWREGGYGPLIMEGDADVVLGLEPFEALKGAVYFLRDGGTVVTNVRPIIPPDRKYPDLEDVFLSLKKIASKVYVVDAVRLAQEAGDVASMNMVVIGAALGAGVLPIPEEALRRVIAERFPMGREANLKAFELGKTMVQEKK